MDRFIRCAFRRFSGGFVGADALFSPLSSLFFISPHTSFSTSRQSFSSIVGPNGSGKSNTIDALLFVFGFRATKMRQGKFSELIHNSGSAPSPADDDEEEGEGEEEDSEGFSEDESEEERPKKGKGGKGKGKKAAPRKGRKDVAYGGGGGCEFATVEVWFREVVDLVR